MRKLSLLILILSQFLGCQNNNKEDIVSIFTNLSLFLFRANKLTLSGTAVKGIVKNAVVTVTPLEENGECSKDNVLAKENTDENGNYSLSFNKTGSVVCVTISARPDGLTRIYDEASDSDIDLAGNSNFQLTNILPEAKISNNNRQNVLVSPFSKMHAKRFQKLVSISGTQADKNSLHKRASKEIVIRFGLHSGLSSASSPSMYSVRAGGGGAISDTFYPELDDLLLELENPASPVTAKFTSILVGLSQLANTYKSGSSLTIEDLDSIIEAFASDFEDGVFDGLTSSGAPVTIGPPGNQITFSGNPLSTILLPAITTYVQNGGQLSLGQTTIIPPPTFTTTDITNQTQFVDNTEITSPSLGSPPNISYPSSPFTLAVNTNIPLIQPVVPEVVTNCSIAPALPLGLILSNECVISGTPTQTQTSTNYTITAFNVAGFGTTNISIIIDNPPPSALTYSSGSYVFLESSTITPLVPTFSGSITSCSASPSLPSGLSINATTCTISGIPSIPQIATNYTITASNALGNTTANFSILVNSQITISYTGGPFNFSQGNLISTLTPNIASGSPSGYSISPSLPAGLSFNPTTGVISGTPSITLASTNFTITVTSAINGNANTIISITVSVPPPTVSYSGSPFILLQNFPISVITPSLTGSVTSCSASPSLPTGLIINTTTCAISGTPTVSQVSTPYTITVTNAGGSTNTNIDIIVKNGKRMFPYNIGAMGGNLGGIAGADSICQTNKPADVLVAKAFIVSSTRRACSTPNCSGGISENLNWVLLPNTTYIQPSGTIVMGTTNASGILILPLSTAIPGNWPYWTGLKQDWTNSVNLCSDWTTTSGNGNRGGVSSSNVDARFIHVDGPTDTGVACNFAGTNMLCVEQ
ncbi:MAG: DUF1554 domain-containing protein [Leptospiraceae bacterium]|nr:DUF1554 domain-containing protein [Leptospiraceae bacterium]